MVYAEDDRYRNGACCRRYDGHDFGNPAVNVPSSWPFLRSDVTRFDVEVALMVAVGLVNKRVGLFRCVSNGLVMDDFRDVVDGGG